MNWLDKLRGQRPKTPVLATIELPPPDPDAPPVRLYGDQPMRKAWAEDVLRGEGVPINPHLPVIESEAEVALRAPREVAERLLALTLVAAKGVDFPQDEFLELVAERGALPLFTDRERAFVLDPAPSTHDRVQFSWRYEAAWALLWPLGHVDGVLGPPREPCDVDHLVDVIRDTPDLDDLAAKGLRRANDVLCETDLIYRYHWAVRQAGIDGKDPPAGLHGGVTMERHQALNWLIGYGERADWEEVGTDT
ncbi:DUF4272 domain-containing protein [Caulobacter mirabilis]|uniref:DUF4272 domain-containing protein n=1 Tax=Caulobacter mirabilis TaxID=69666 RepID=UPI001558B3E4|nr:DUF4272 domain-containing protein [Caulobacter mirabilis]